MSEAHQQATFPREAKNGYDLSRELKSHLGDWAYQWFSLAWTPDDWNEAEKLGFDPAPQHQRGTHFAQLWERVAEIASRSGDKRQAKEVARIFYFENYLEPLLSYASICSGILPAHFREMIGELVNFFTRMPTAFCEHALWEARLMNRQKGWEQHDFTDIQCLGPALAYCDVVVTEKSWRSIAIQAKLDQRFKTRIFANLDQAISYLEESGANKRP